MMTYKKEPWEERRSRQNLKRHGDRRSQFGRDLARVIHSAAFRRLQGKTQVLGIGEGDFYRTRLTHSMEAAQIGRGIASKLEKASQEPTWLFPEVKPWLPPQNLIEVICLSHDLGHPPFGHGGEVALNFMMRKHGGFEGNGQTLRLLTRLEAHTEGYGLDLTRRVLLGILKYPVRYSKVRRKSLPKPPVRIQVRSKDWKPPKCFLDCETKIVSWILESFNEKDRKKFQSFDKPTNDKHSKPKERSLDASIMEIADDIAYGVHDLEDAIALHLVTRDQLEERLRDTVSKKWLRISMGLAKTNDLLDQLFSESNTRKQAIGGLVNALITSVEIMETSRYDHPLLRYKAVLSSPARKLLEALKDFVNQNIIKSPQVQTLEYRGEQIIMAIFVAVEADPERLMKESFQRIWHSVGSEEEKIRIICDYIAGMTDEYATRMFERLFMPRHGTVFERL
jgi:dGTPase